jgi:hypothetical protein
VSEKQLRTLLGGLLNHLNSTEALAVPPEDLRVAVEVTVTKARDRGWLSAR